ncbi:MAG: tRNA pseudouridine(65) synthase TruC [Aquificaceae bacterium]|nr:MAG: tRNA pseudouridine(65) synthase TruC [Aquificaceae bacterium]
MLEILYQDDVLVAINKPSGLLVHRSMIDHHETAFAMQQTRDQIGQHVFPVHRLDKPTSGVLLFALDRDTARQVTQQFADKKIQKSYRAVVRGYTQAAGTIDYALKEQLDKMTDSKVKQDKEAQAAITHYRREAMVELPFAVGRYDTARYSLVKLMPETGRKHQIRRHMKHIFHPIVGDTSHGDGKHNSLFREQFACHRLLLHADCLALKHPLSGDELVIHAALHDDFQSIVEHLFSIA